MNKEYMFLYKIGKVREKDKIDELDERNKRTRKI